MENMGWLFIFKLLMLVTIQLCSGSFQYDLFDTVNLSADPITVAGTSPVVGPIKRSFGIEFSNKTADIKLNDDRFAYLANMIQTSKDLTFAVRFKIMGTVRKDLRYFPFFALTDSKLLHNYFSIGLQSQQVYIMVEGKKEFTGEIEWSVNIDQWVSRAKQSSKTSLKLPLKEKDLGEWIILMVRIKEDNVEVSLDCKNVVNGKLMNGRIGSFSYDGWLTFSQFLKKVGGEIKKDQFVGMLYEPQLINGQEAFDWFNPCTSDRTPSKVVSEPRPSEYNPKKFNKFQEMSHQPNPKPIVYCTDENGIKRRNNGDSWRKGKCFKSRCVNGQIIESYACRKCEDNDGNFYRTGDTWIDKTDNCLQKTCDDYQEIERLPIQCKTLTCPEDEQYKPKDECCPKCRGDDCSQGKEYIAGCERKCSYGGQFQCKTKTKGCWCPKGTAMNHEQTYCIPTRDCNCISVSNKIFLPGQSIVKSQCSICVCSNGQLICFDTC